VKQRLKYLEETLHKEVPLTRDMGVRVEAHDGQELVFSADLQPNINIHGTAFGGSLYSICAVVCWGMLHLKFQEAGLPGHSVLGGAKINYKRPIKSHIVARCKLPEDGSFESFLETLKGGERARVELIAEIFADEKLAVQFVGSYSAHL